MSALLIDEGIAGTGGAYRPDRATTRFAEADYCGRSFNGGLVRFHDSVTGPMFRDYVRQAFPDLVVGADVLAFDWRGRQVVTQPDSDQLLIADPDLGATIEFLTVAEFALILSHDAASSVLDGEDLARWIRASDAEDPRIPWSKAVSPRVPAFAGGESGFEDLELSDLEVLWDFTAQVLEKIRDLPPGAHFTFR